MVRGAVRMCENNYADAMKGVANHTPAPRGRPPFGYRYVLGKWRHMETGDPFDSQLHVAGVRARKQACMNLTYLGEGGRDRRLARYIKKRKPAAWQITLPELGEPGHGTTESLAACSVPGCIGSYMPKRPATTLALAA